MNHHVLHQPSISFLGEFFIYYHFQQYPKAPSHIENSFQLVEKLTNLRINNNFLLISLDVISLFINVPINLALESIDKR